MSRSGGHRTDLIRFKPADLMAHAREHFGDQYSDNGIILDDQNAKALHDAIGPILWPSVSSLVSQVTGIGSAPIMGAIEAHLQVRS